MNCATKVRFFLSNFWGQYRRAAFSIVFSAKTTQKSLVNQGFFLLYLDAPYRDLERTFILRAIKNIEI
ncbi:hypothetical protein B7699_04025 [Streptococcus mitis]|uniref:Uncharacterized protein n=1 Tax=Streptococcus mitis TaxID=28037 RepID=A0A1X1K4T0_STRMT|nr:hypothetical protein B7699_04025 [Streptococcus mitis]